MPTDDEQTDIRVLDIDRFTDAVQDELSALIARMQKYLPNDWAEFLPLILAGQLGALFQRLTEGHDQVLASVNQVFDRMVVPYRLRSMD